MYKGNMVIDTHGHISTPPHFRAYAYNLIALRTPGEGFKIPEAPMRQALERHLRMLDERNIDVQLISPRPIAMMHWERPFLVEAWTKVTNDTIAQQVEMYPKRFVGVAQLPQTREMNIQACVDELDRCVSELGFVAALINPDPGADRKAPGMDQEAWFPLYAKAEQLNASLVVHPSVSHDPRIERIPHSYQYNNFTEETLATLLLEHGDVFERFPKLRIMVCHCGGAPRRLIEVGDRMDACNPSHGPDNVVGKSGEQAGGSVGMANEEAHKEKADISGNLFFDTCAYDPWFLAAAIRQRGPHRMAFGSETPGSGSALLNPMTGRPADDILAMIDRFDFLDDRQKCDIVHNNPRRMFPLLSRSAAL